ncbi:transmembrane protein, putative [Medicago truncatula]|uniref:Transmembrane protein, putative n=1 Tax=Medicago truncatula TaxID=3880 RepID=G7KM90_MEDTR|nr:transmembrane protein, putative [Medicago truncatula]
MKNGVESLIKALQSGVFVSYGFMTFIDVLNVLLFWKIQFRSLGSDTKLMMIGIT